MNRLTWIEAKRIYLTFVSSLKWKFWFGCDDWFPFTMYNVHRWTVERVYFASRYNEHWILFVKNPLVSVRFSYWISESDWNFVCCLWSSIENWFPNTKFNESIYNPNYLPDLFNFFEHFNRRTESGKWNIKGTHAVICSTKNKKRINRIQNGIYIRKYPFVPNFWFGLSQPVWRILYVCLYVRSDANGFPKVSTHTHSTFLHILKNVQCSGRGEKSSR